MRRADFEAVKTALEAAGFVYRHVKSNDIFLDGRGAKARAAVHILLAGEKARSEDLSSTPDVSESEAGADSRTIGLEPLVRRKLTSYRRKDHVHLLDMLDVGLIDETWLARLEPALSSRLKVLLDNPEG